MSLANRDPAPLPHLLHSWPLFHTPLTVSRRMICGMISATARWPAKDWWLQLGSSCTTYFSPFVWFLSFSLWPPTFNTALQPSQVSSLTLSHTIAQWHSTSRGELFCWIHQMKQWIKDRGRLYFSLQKELGRKSLWTVSRPSAALCNWVDLKVDLLGWLSVCGSVYVCTWIHACLFGTAYEAVTFLSGHHTHFLEVFPVLFEHSCS